MVDQWQPRQFFSSMYEMDRDAFLASFGNMRFLLVDIEDASDRLISGLFHTSPLVRHDTPLMEELTGATDLGSSRHSQPRSGRASEASSLAVEILSDISMRSRFLSPICRRLQDDATMITVGRNLSNDIILKHASISRVHATFEVGQDEPVVVTDMGSKNGSWLNGKRFLGERTVQNGDTLRFGQIEAVMCDAEVLWQVVRPEASSFSSGLRK